jgi:hypothetical protein
VLVADVLGDEGLVHEELLADLGPPLFVANLHDLRLHPLVQVLLDLREEQEDKFPAKQVPSCSFHTMSIQHAANVDVEQHHTRWHWLSAKSHLLLLQRVLKGVAACQPGVPDIVHTLLQYRLLCKQCDWLVLRRVAWSRT